MYLPIKLCYNSLSYSSLFLLLIVFLQLLSEMEEIITYKKLCLTASPEEAELSRNRMLDMWDRRLAGCQRDVNEWMRIMTVRSLVLENHQRVDTQLQFVSLCRQQNRMGLALKALMRLGITIDSSSEGLEYSFLPHAEMDKCKHLSVLYAFQKFLFAADEKEVALKNLREMVRGLDPHTDVGLKVKMHLKLGKWQLALHERNLTPVGPYILCPTISISTYHHINISSWLK